MQPPLRTESRWPITLTICAVIAVQVLLARDLSIEPSWLLPSVETAILAVLLLANPTQQIHDPPRLPRLHLALAGVLSFATVATVWQLVDALIHGSNLPPVRLLANALAVWLSSAVAFSLWYWDLDAGGPSARAFGSAGRSPAFLFPQQMVPDLTPGWRPTYGDYLYLSFTNQRTASRNAMSFTNQRTASRNANQTGGSRVFPGAFRASSRSVALGT